MESVRAGDAEELPSHAARVSVGEVVLVAAQQAAQVSDNKKMTKPKIQGMIFDQSHLCSKKCFNFMSLQDCGRSH